VVDRKRLSAADWTKAALEALAAGGVGAVAVEPLAARLGATKGSFYWHFSGRDALLEAALALWERTDTEDVITLVDAEPDPRERLRTLLAGAIRGARRGTAGAVELALQPSATHPLVAPVLARVTRRRLGYLATTFTELGFTPDHARQRALLAYTAYLGHAQLAHATPGETPSGPALPGYVDEVIATLTAR
jgi:AcrR family transcriptional regulator